MGSRLWTYAKLERHSAIQHFHVVMLCWSCDKMKMFQKPMLNGRLTRSDAVDMKTKMPQRIDT